MKVALALVCAVSSLLLSSCASAVGWGKPFDIVQSNSRSVTIEYDSVICSYKRVAAAADLEAAKYGKVAVARNRIDSRGETIFGGVQTIVFDLVNP